MKNKDFERLKEICEREGFEIEISSPWDQTYRIFKKDPWDGVYFVEAIESIKDQFTKGKIYKVKTIDSKSIDVELDDSGSTKNGWVKNLLKPSTEQAYIEQLKKEAFERFGLIKVGDEFKAEWNNVKANTIAKEYDPDKWTYDSSNDRLFLAKMGDGGAIIYQQGEWAERVKEMIKVTYIDWECADNKMEVNFSFKINNWKTVKDKDDVGDFLSQKLENHLNS